MSYSNAGIGNKQLQGKANDYLAFWLRPHTIILQHILNNVTENQISDWTLSEMCSLSHDNRNQFSSESKHKINTVIDCNLKITETR